MISAMARPPGNTLTASAATIPRVARVAPEGPIARAAARPHDRREASSGEGAMWKEFREFAMRGNVVDLAVGVVIGAAFGKIVTSLVGDIVMPPLGLVL